MFPFASVYLSSSYSHAVVDSENRIYEDIDRNSVGSHSTSAAAGLETPDNQPVSSTTAATTADSGFSCSGRTRQQAPGSDDSWGSGEFETFSSDETIDDDDDDDNDSEKIHSPT